MRPNRPKLEEKQMNNDPTQTPNDPTQTPNEPGGDGGTLSAVVESLQAKIRERDEEVERWKKTVEDRDKTITLLLNGGDGGARPTGDVESFRKKCNF